VTHVQLPHARLQQRLRRRVRERAAAGGGHVGDSGAEGVGGERGGGGGRAASSGRWNGARDGGEGLACEQPALADVEGGEPREGVQRRAYVVVRGG
jgi:hypothetical protein